MAYTLKMRERDESECGEGGTKSAADERHGDLLRAPSSGAAGESNHRAARNLCFGLTALTLVVAALTDWNAER